MDFLLSEYAVISTVFFKDIDRGTYRSQVGRVALHAKVCNPFFRS